MCIYTCMSHVYMCIYTCMSHAYMCIYTCMSHVYMCIYTCLIRHASWRYSPITHEWVTSHINKTCHVWISHVHMSESPRMYESRVEAMSHNKRTGCRRLTGSSKLQIIFHKRATKYRSLLRKMTYKDKGSYESSPPCSPNTHECV